MSLSPLKIMEWLDMAWSRNSWWATSPSTTRLPLRSSWTLASNRGRCGTCASSTPVSSNPSFPLKFLSKIGIDVYGKCGCLDNAGRVFDRMLQRNTFTWNSIIIALIRWGFLHEAVQVFGSMPEPNQCSWN